MAIWLLKTEPDNYSFADLERDGETVWDGVKQPLALQYLRQMKAGDHAIIYHTGTQRACIGSALVTRDAYADPHATRKSGRFVMCAGAKSGRSR